MSEIIYIQEKLFGNPGYIVTFDANGKAILTSRETQVIANLTVRSSPGFDIYAFLGNQQIQLIESSLTPGTYTATLPNTGTWNIVAYDIIGRQKLSKQLRITTTGDYTLNLFAFTATIIVHTSGADNVTCSLIGGTQEDVQENSSGDQTVIFIVPKQGTWQITANYSNPTQTVDISQEVQISGTSYELDASRINSAPQLLMTNFSMKTTNKLDMVSWGRIKELTQAGLIDIYYDIGDEKQIEINGVNYIARIIAFNHNTNIESNGQFTTTFQIVSLADLRNRKITQPGLSANSDIGIKYLDTYLITGLTDQYTNDLCIYSGSELRNRYLIGNTSESIYYQLPIDVKENLIKVNKYCLKIDTTNNVFDEVYDYIYIPSMYELLGEDTLVFTNATDNNKWNTLFAYQESLMCQQFEYYKYNPISYKMLYDTENSTFTTMNELTRSIFVAEDRDSMQYCRIGYTAIDNQKQISLLTQQAFVSPTYIQGSINPIFTIG